MEESKKAVALCPSWMAETTIEPNGKVAGTYKFEIAHTNILAYCENLRDGTYDVQAIYLRDEVWSLSMKMSLIHSICHSVNIPTFWLAENDLDTARYDIIDSKNRSGAILDFFNNEFPIPVCIDGVRHFFYWEYIDKCTKNKKNLNPTQKRLIVLRSTIRNYNITLNTVYGCSMKQRSEIAALLSKSVSWTTEEELYNFYWFSKCMFRFLFNFCMVETKLNTHINRESVRINHRDMGTIWISKVLFLLYGTNFNDRYSGDRSVGNSIRSWNRSGGGKSEFLAYQQNVDNILLEFSKENEEILINSKESCKKFFDFLINKGFKLADFNKRIVSLKKTCELIYNILHVHPINSSKKEKQKKGAKEIELIKIVKPLAPNELFDIVLHTERLIQNNIFTHAMMSQNKLSFSGLFKSFRNKKNELGAEGTAQSTTGGRIEQRRKIFDECVENSGLDTGPKNKKITKKQKQDALWDSDGKDPISKETLFEPQFDHHISTKISSDPQKVSVVNKDTNILKSGMTEEFAKVLIAYNKKVRKEANSKDKKVRKEVNSKDKKLKRCAKKRPL